MAASQIIFLYFIIHLVYKKAANDNTFIYNKNKKLSSSFLFLCEALFVLVLKQSIPVVWDYLEWREKEKKRKNSCQLQIKIPNENHRLT